MKEHYRLDLNEDEYLEFTPEEWAEVFPKLDDKQVYYYFDGNGGESYMSVGQCKRLMNSILTPANNDDKYKELEKKAIDTLNKGLLEITIDGSIFNEGESDEE